MKKKIIISILLVFSLYCSLSFSNFTVHSNGMEKTLLRGDVIVTKTNTFLENIDLSRNDIAVFHYPGNRDRNDEFGGIIQNSEIIKRPILAQRCVGLPGDIFEIKQAGVYANSKNVKDPLKSKKYYIIESNEGLKDEYFEKNEIAKIDYYRNEVTFFYKINATISEFNKLKDSGLFKIVYPDILMSNFPSEYQYRSFPYKTDFIYNNRDNIGKIVIPKKGLKVKLDRTNIQYYKSIILDFDNNKNATYSKGELFINGNKINEYTFKQNYYFMLGDNRYESDDSRFWGFVPEDHLIGYPAFILYSTEQNKSFFSGIRWERILKFVL